MGEDMRQDDAEQIRAGSLENASAFEHALANRIEAQLRGKLDTMLDERIGGALRKNARTVWSGVVSLIVAGIGLASWLVADRSAQQLSILELRRDLNEIRDHGSKNQQEFIRDQSAFNRRQELNMVRVMDKLGVQPVDGGPVRP
jgi:hypothetical protein